MNAYFAGVEQQANPFLRGRPIAVVGKPRVGAIVTAPSYEAKAYGVKTGMPTWEAKRLCPGILFVVEDLNKYAWVSARIFSILRGFSPLLEVFSIDEAFLEITQTSKKYGDPLEVARAIKREIKSKLGPCLRCSIGIAPSKRVLRWPYPDFEGARETLQLLCANVARRLRRKGYAGRVVHFYASSPDGYSAGRRRALGAPTADEAVIYETCLGIAEELQQMGKLPGELEAIHVSVGRLCRREGLSLSLFEGERRRERLMAVMDLINDEYGEFSVYFGGLQAVRAGERPDWTVASIALHRQAM
jgi:nucleotidyltransferase/DNA polymerase involved in DNA repair